MERALFFPYNAASWGELTDLARLLKERGLASASLLLCGAEMAAREGETRALGLEAACLPDAPAGPPPRTGLWPGRLLSSLRWRMRGPAAQLEEQRQGHLRRLIHQREQLAAALDRLRPTVVVVADERLPHWELPLLSLCRQRGIPSLMAPAAYLGDRESLLPRRTGEYYLARNFPELARRFPAQAVESPQAGGKVFFYEAPLMAALAELKMLPPNPWVLGGSLTDRVLAESQEAYARQVAQGAPPARILVSGLLAHDRLHELWQGVSEQERRQGPLALALPQLAEEGMLEPERAMEEIHFLCRTLAQAVAAMGLPPSQVWVSLHPRMDPERYRFISGDYGLTIASQRLAQFLPRARLLLCCYSSTIFWATLCRVPVLNFDFYGYGYANWDFLTGARFINNKDQFAPALAQVLGDPQEYDRLVAGQERWAPLLSPFDGRCGQRIMEAVIATAQGREVIW